MSLSVESMLKSTQSKPHAEPKNAKLWGIAQDFESTFLGSMLGQITSGLSGDGPLGGDGAGGDAWRGMLSDEMAKSVSKSGGIGVAQTIYSELLSLQSRSGTSA